MNVLPPTGLPCGTGGTIFTQLLPQNMPFQQKQLDIFVKRILPWDISNQYSSGAAAIMYRGTSGTPVNVTVRNGRLSLFLPNDSQKLSGLGCLTLTNCIKVTSPSVGYILDNFSFFLRGAKLSTDLNNTYLQLQCIKPTSD